MKTVIMKMTDAYDYQSFIEKLNNPIFVDCRDLEGTRCYCDDSACLKIRERIADLSFDGLHFIDSGNYHYLSLFWLEKIKQDFNLILFDHHPDDQPPSFGDILSCGGWVLKAKESLPHLKNVYSFGVGEEIDASLIPTDLPVYISIDKDVLSGEFALTDWDQGMMSLQELKEILSTIFKRQEVLGVDICGESGEEAQSSAYINSQTNAFLFDFLSANF